MRRFGGCLALFVLTTAFVCAVPVGSPMDFTRGNDVWLQVKTREEARAELAPLLDEAKKCGITSFEPYVKWMLLEPEEGKWDFAFYDMQVEECAKRGMKWTPFLIAGPAYATPKWFKESKQSVFAKCLEHGTETRTQSIWNPAMPKRVDAFVKAFARHFDHSLIQSVLLGISGDFGESIFTVEGNYWTYLFDGEYHHHRGWWCGDAYAERSFRDSVRRRYSNVSDLNVAWDTRYTSFDQVKPFLPDKAPSRQARLDLVRWYRNSMTRYAEVWLKTVRKHMPKTEVMLCTGGQGISVHGADFTQQAVAAAKLGCGMRITNEASDYGENFMLTRLVGSACRNLGTYFGYEPASGVSDEGVVGRFYNAVASGADELFVYDSPASGPRGDIYRRCVPFLTKRNPDVKVAMFYCKTSEELGVEGFSKGGDDYYSHCAQFRDYADFDILDETSIAKGWLKRYKALVWMDGAVTENATLKALESWIKSGGQLFLRVPAEEVSGKKWKLKAVEVASGTDADEWFRNVAKAAPDLFPDGKKDGLFLTTLSDGNRLLYNSTGAELTFDSRPVPPHSITETKPAPRS